jgi:glycine oxidase
MNADFIIVGGGVIGLAVARELRLRGAGSVAVLERGLLAREASYAAAGMLAVQAETDRFDRFFEFCAGSNSMYDDFTEALSSETGVDVELDSTGTIYTAFDEADADELDRRFEWQSQAGLRVSRLDSGEVLGLEPEISPDVRGGLFFPGDRQVDNRRLLEALEASVRGLGVEVVEGCEAVEVVIEEGRATGVRTNATLHSGGTVVIATGAWTSLIGITSDPLAGFKPVKGEILSLGPSRGLLRHVVYSPRGYVVPRSDGRLIAGATTEDAGFDRAPTVDGRESILGNVAQIVPKLGELEVREHLAGLRPFAEGGRPSIGEVPGFENLFVAAGHYRNGILLAPATAALVADRVTATPNDFASDFAPRDASTSQF